MQNLKTERLRQAFNEMKTAFAGRFQDFFQIKATLIYHSKLTKLPEVFLTWKYKLRRTGLGI